MSRSRERRVLVEEGTAFSMYAKQFGTLVVVVVEGVLLL